MQANGTAIILAHTATIVSAHLRRTATGVAELPALIRSVHAALATVSRGGAAAEKRVDTPAQTIFPDHLICLEDGRALKTLKRHLQTNYGLTPEAYRAKWNLPSDYPMVAPAYAEARSTLAKSLGLGRKRARPAAEPEADPAPVAAPDSPVQARRAEPTAESVFANFPRAQAPETEPETEEPPLVPARRPARTPFAQQLARTMRR